MDDLYGSIEETTLNDDLLDEEGLRQWFKKGGWRQAGGKYDGKPCARQPGQKTTPKCVSRKKYRSMSKKERESAGRRKRKKDPNQTKKRGAAKPTYVKTDPQKGGRKKKRKSKKKNEELQMTLEQIIQEELEAVIDEKRKKKKKKKKGGKKDACYHKVKSRYKVWPSAYASGALVKCRKVGAKNWGNSTKEELEINIHNELDLIVQESHSAADEKKLKKIAKQLRNSTKMHADQAEDLEDIVDRSPDDELKEVEEADEINEGMNCGCGSDPCETYGKDGEKLVIMVKEELQNIIDEKKKKKKSAKDRMKCNSSRRIRKGEPGYGKKKFVVKACEGGTEKIIRYGDANMEIKKDSPKRRKSFRARHNCKNPGSKLKARYWSCKKW
jgi:hypothetical protein